MIVELVWNWIQGNASRFIPSYTFRYASIQQDRDRFISGDAILSPARYDHLRSDRIVPIEFKIELHLLKKSL